MVTEIFRRYLMLNEGQAVSGVFRRFVEVDGRHFAVLATATEELYLPATSRLLAALSSPRMRGRYVGIEFVRRHQLAQGRVLWEVSVAIARRVPFGLSGSLRRQKRRVVRP